MKKSRKKGFTLVELLVVIAILAVLASVSVIGYLGFVKKSRISNDVSLTTQMNTVLAANEASDGKNVTAYDAIAELKEDGGFDVNKISPTTDGYYYAFDSKTNRMVLLDEKNNLIAPENVSISGHERDVFLLIGNENEIKDDTKFSYYLKDGFTSDGTLDISTGLDVGENTNISTIKYTNSGSAQNVIIRTSSSSTNLTVEAPSDTMKHYGSLGTSTLKEISDHSFWEHGKTAFVELTKGRIVLTEDADVEIINVTKNDNGNGYNNPIIADGGVKEENMPSMISRDAVSTSESETNLVQIQKLNSNGEVTATEQVKSYSSGSTGSTVKNDTQNTDVDSILGGIVLDTANNAGGKAMSDTQKEEEKARVVLDATSSEKSLTPENIENGVVLNSTTGKYYSKAEGTNTDTVVYCKSSESALRTAVENAKVGDMLYLFEDVTFTDKHSTGTDAGLNIKTSIQLDGQGHTIKYNNSSISNGLWTEENDNGYETIIDVIGIKSGTVNIKNVTLVAEMTQYAGIHLGNINENNRNSKFTLNLDNVIINTRDTTKNDCHGYPIKIGSTAQDINVNLNDVTTYGWGGIQSTSNGVNLVANNCSFNTENIVKNESNRNYFSTIVLSEYYNNGAGNSEDNDFTFNKCTFVAKEPTKNEQKVLDIRSPYNNTAKLNGCTFNCDNDFYFGVCFASNYQSSRSNSSYDGCSRVYVDGLDVTYTDEHIKNYLDGSDLNSYALIYTADPFPMLANELEYNVEHAEIDGNTTIWVICYGSKYYEVKVVYDETAKTWTITLLEVTE